MRVLSSSPDETMDIGQRLAQKLPAGAVVAFTGGLGSGKTTFCRGLAIGLGVRDAVQSPTFAIANLYRGPRPMAHFDAWRVEGPEDLAAAGFYDYLDGGAVVAVEWAEKVAALLEDPVFWVHIRVLGDGRREVVLEGIDEL